MLEADLIARGCVRHRGHAIALADCAASAIVTQSANTGQWQRVLPRQTGKDQSKERYIGRLLGNWLIDDFLVMRSFAQELIGLQAKQKLTVILMLDQSKIKDGLECLMVCVRVGARALPVFWLVEQTQGPNGFEKQEQLLKQVSEMIPAEARILLMADRFYGTASLVKLCQHLGWDYRIRLKSNNIFFHEGGEISTGDAVKSGISNLTHARFNETDVITNIGIVHEPGHPEPWIIAMGSRPSKTTVLDYGSRWGIECMFSDLKSRGFDITKTHLEQPARIKRLILVLTIALYWAVSTGAQTPQPNAHNASPKKTERSSLSLFTNGIRSLLRAALNMIKIPILWLHLKSVRC
jgi:hypothetical protein